MRSRAAQTCAQSQLNNGSVDEVAKSLMVRSTGAGAAIASTTAGRLCSMVQPASAERVAAAKATAACITRQRSAEAACAQAAPAELRTPSRALKQGQGER